MNTRCAALLRESLDLPESERRQFLEQASAGDAPLLANLLRLLELDAGADPLLDASLDRVVSELMTDRGHFPDESLDYVARDDSIVPR